MAKEVVGRGRKFRIERDPAWEPGRHEATFTIHDLHYHDGQDWQEVNEALVDDGADGFAKRCDTTAHALRLGSGGTRRWYPRRNVAGEYVAITDIEYYTNRWRQLNLPAAVWKSNGADWDLANLSASITNTWRRVKTDFVLKDATAPTRLRFAITLVGLTLNANWELTSTTDSSVVGWLDPPTATDATGAAVPVSATYAGGFIEWSVDPTGFTFPIHVDPTFTDGPSGDVNSAYDSYIGSDGPTTIHGNETTLQFNGTSRRVLIKFDVSSLSGATINSATLSLWGSEVQYWSATTINWYAVASANADWSEYGALDGCNWNYKNNNGSVAWAGSAGCSTAGTDYINTVIATRNFTANEEWTNSERTFSVDTSQISSWASGTNGGMVGWQTGYTGAHSAEATTSGYRPKLVVDYTAASTGQPTTKRFGDIPFSRGDSGLFLPRRW